MKTWFFYLLAFLQAILLIYGTYFVERHEFTLLLGLWAGLFGIYLFFLFSPKYFISQSGRVNWLHLVIIPLILRAVLLWALPNLSDDYFRFFWDGKIIIAGFNPYLNLPTELMESNFAQKLGLSKALFAQLNSPNYYTVYPPIHQLGFAFGAASSPNSIWGAVIAMRLLILFAEAGSLIFMIYLSRQFHLSPSLVRIYAFNPLVIMELTGNLHFEALVIFFLLMGIYFLHLYQNSEPLTRKKNQYFILSQLAFALSIGVKLLPLLFLPLFLRLLGWKRAFLYYTGVGFFLILIFLPFLQWQLIENMMTSVNLYFQSFEFNASIYYLARGLGYWIYGYNIIHTTGPFLSLLNLILLLTLALWPGLKLPTLPTRMLWMLTIYYFLSTTIHPWYISLLIFLTVFKPNYYVILWSALAFLSYATYQTSSYTENLWLVGVEYLLVDGLLIYELIKGNRIKYLYKEPTRI